MQLTAKFNFGDKVKDSVTDFTGTITGVAFYATGCTQYSVVGKSIKNADAPAIWLDEGRVIVLKSAMKPNVAKDTGGPQAHPPEKH